jgi:nucleotide-binding universal stress UspA family protein
MYQRILVPVDGSATSSRGLEEAIRVAMMSHGKLRLIHVIDELSFALAMDASWGGTSGWIEMLREGGAKLLDEAAAQVHSAGLDVESVLFDNFAGPVDVQVVKEAVDWKADLIVLGTHGRRGVGRVVMGSSAERILRTAPVPVLLVRTPEAQQAATEAIAAQPATRARATPVLPPHITVSLPSAALAVERV